MRLRFGTFMAPFHPPEHSPTQSLTDDLDLLVHMDKLGFDEAWIGEHHSAGSEIIASPEIFIATAAERTKNIKLGTGVVSLPYHNPLWVDLDGVSRISDDVHLDGPALSEVGERVAETMLGMRDSDGDGASDQTEIASGQPHC